MHAGMQHVSQKENIWYVWAISINVSYEVKKLSGSYYAYVGPHLEIALKPDNLVMTDCWLLKIEKRATNMVNDLSSLGPWSAERIGKGNVLI